MRASIFALVLFTLIATLSTLAGYLVLAAGTADDGSAGRYHLRERIGDFFDRDVLAARYHLRTRTAKFFGRGAC